MLSSYMWLLATVLDAKEELFLHPRARVGGLPMMLYALTAQSGHLIEAGHLRVLGMPRGPDPIPTPRKLHREGERQGDRQGGLSPSDEDASPV